MIKIPLEYTIKIGKILIEFAGANSRILKEHSDFISYLTEDNRFGHEYRFMGSLGSGGKLCSLLNGGGLLIYPHRKFVNLNSPKMKKMKSVWK